LPPIPQLYKCNYCLHMKYISVTIERFTHSSQPGFVECSFIDAWNKTQVFEDKVPIFTTQHLDETSLYPQAGVIAGEILREWRDADGRDIVTVTTEHPWGVASKEGTCEFDLLKEQLTKESL